MKPAKPISPELLQQAIDDLGLEKRREHLAHAGDTWFDEYMRRWADVVDQRIMAMQPKPEEKP